MCLYAHQHFLKSEVTFWDVCFRVLYPLTVRWKKAQFSSKRNIPKTTTKKIHLRGTVSLFCFFFHSHPDCLKLPHGEKTKWKCRVSNLSWPTSKLLAFRWIRGWMGCSLFRRCYEFCNSIPLKTTSPSLTPTSLTQHTHTPPRGTGAAGSRLGGLGQLGGLLWAPDPLKLNAGLRGRLLRYNRGGMFLCVWGRVHFLFFSFFLN